MVDNTSKGLLVPSKPRQAIFSRILSITVHQVAPRLLATRTLTSRALGAARACTEAEVLPLTGNESKTKSFEQNLPRCKPMTIPLLLDEGWEFQVKGLSAGEQITTQWNNCFSCLPD